VDRIFLTILNMSLTGAFVIAVICLARFVLKKAPKAVLYCLWIAAGFRLLSPISIEGAFSLIPFKPEPVQSEWVGINYTYEENAVKPESAAGENGIYGDVSPVAVILSAVSYIWPVGAGVMITRCIVSYVKLKRRMKMAVHIEGNIYEAGYIETPFVFGVFSPKIYIPAGLSCREAEYIILHEQTHIRRRDHLIKLLAYFVLCLHWFNPLVWVAFLLMDVDMEMCCDESVLSKIGMGTKKDYSQSLLRLATQQRFVGGIPVAFGEGGVKTRVKNVLGFRNRSRAVVIAGVILAAVLSAGFSVDKMTGAVAGEPGFIRICVRTLGRYTSADTVKNSKADSGSLQETAGGTKAGTTQRKILPGYKVMKLSAAEVNTTSLSILLTGDMLPEGRYYSSMDNRGDELIIYYYNVSE